jgi:hypothetical protein
MEPRRLGRLLARQEEELGALDAAAQQALLAVLLLADEELRTALLRLQEGLPAGQERTPFSAQQARVLLLLVRSATRTLTDRGVGALAAQARAGAALGGRHALELLELDPELAPLLAAVQAAEPGLRLPPALAADQAPGEEDGLAVGQPLRARMVAQVARDGLLVQRVEASLARYGADLADQMKREVAVGLATNQSLPDIAARLSGLGGVLATARGRGMLIARMETAGAYDVGHREAAGLAAGSINAALGVGGRPPLVMRASEHIDDLRNHPFSQVVHGMTRPMDDTFQVRVDLVQLAAQRLRSRPGLPGQRAMRGKGGLRVSGVLWPIVGGAYQGDTYPAHFHDRGRQHLWRASWGVSEPDHRSGVQGQPDPRGGRPRTEPVRPYDPDAKPGGRPKKPRKDAGSRLPDLRENEAALMLAQLGFNVVQLPEPKDQQGADYTINGVAWDCIAPSTPRALNALGRAKEKALDRQAQRVVINLADSPLTASELKAALDAAPGYFEGAGLEELLVLTPRPGKRPLLTRLW